MSSDSLIIIYLVTAYLSVGYIVGIPLAALLDYVLGNGGRLASGTAVFIWPLTLLLALAILPLVARDALRRRSGEAMETPRDE